MAYTEQRYIVRCSCGWRAEMPVELVHGSGYYTDRLKRIGYEQHETHMKAVQ